MEQDSDAARQDQGLELSAVLHALCNRASGYSINLNGRINRNLTRNPLRGGTASVYHGTLMPDGTEVAVKTFHCTQSGSADELKRIFQEVHLWSKLRHENVVRMLGISTEFESTVSIISEWMPFGNAYDYVQDAENDPRPLLKDIASGLCYLHNYISPPGPIVHGDLKGVNVLVSSDRRALLCDFGFSTINISTFNMSVDAHRGGSFPWMAPELLDDNPASQESDVWAFGMTVLELFTRSIPFRDCRSVAVLTTRLMMGKLPPRPADKSVQYRLSDVWWNICMSCWRRDPLSRPTMNDIIKKVKAANTVKCLQPTAEDLIEQCPRFRLLVVGKPGVGISTLINRIFGVETASVVKDCTGEADIEQEFTSPQNNRLIFHYSKGFELGDGDDHATVQSFIEKRKKMPNIRDQLHAVWLCFQIPIPPYSERLLEDSAEAFLRMRKEVLGNTPTIIVFTKYDQLMSFTLPKMAGDLEAEQRYMQEFCIQPIEDLTGDKGISSVAVSSKPKYEQSLRDLINLTQAKVSKSFASPEYRVSPVVLALADAQQVVPTSKVDLSIEVGKQRYWQALGSSANFQGYRMRDCLRVIHIDIVSVWNFYDPCQYLNNEKFQNLIMNMVDTVDASAGLTLHQPLRSDSLDQGVPLIGLTPVILPLNAIVTLGKWVYQTYQRLQDAPTKFMAYIVDLTHVLEILFSLTASMRAKKLTRTVIKLAYRAYWNSEWMVRTHTDIRLFQCSSTARDVVLDKITSMLSSDDGEIRVSRTLERIPSVDLEKDEEWVEQDISQ
ncbi:kinase-like domain-containing protein [Pisolithus marmoratus]|nr:kinase-like domain-containing protein [Pisolithus marmoratus]